MEIRRRELTRGGISGEGRGTREVQRGARAPHRVGVESCYCAWDLVLYK